MALRFLNSGYFAGKVGIGTDNPDQKLQVEFANSDTSFSGGSGGDWGSEGIRIENTLNTVDTMAILHFRNNDADVHIASIRQGSNDSDLGFFFEGAEKVRFTNNGNVGIGTDNPDSKLELYEESTTAPTLVTLHTYSADTTPNGTQGSFIDFKKTDDNASFTPQARIGMLIKDSNGDQGIISEGCGNLVFHTSRGTDAAGAGEDVERMRITDIGNVGIGTTTPASKLELRREDSGDLLTFDRLGVDTGTIKVTSTYLAINTADGLSTIFNDGQLDVDFVVKTDNTDRLLFVEGSSGNVGIGTDSPDSQLEVYYEAAGSTGAQIKLGSGDVGYETTITNYRRTTDSTFEIASYDDTILGYNRSTDKTWLGIGSNVGIGTASPGTKLEVSSSGAEGILISKDTGNTSNSGRLFFETDTVSEGFSFLNSNGLMTIRSQAQAAATSGNVRVTINGSGNVGINTTAAQAKLEVVTTRTGPPSSDTNIKVTDDTAQAADVGGSINFTGKYTNSGTYLGGSPFIRAAKKNSNDGDYGYGLKFGVRATGSGTSNVAMTIDSDSNVGIGTTTPDSLLEISQQLSAVSTIDYPYTISSRDDGNLINQLGGEGVGIKFRIAGNAGTTPGDSLVGASIAAIREMADDNDSSTGLGFFVTQNDETLDEALRIDHDKNANFLSNVDIADSLDVTNSIDLGTQVWKTYTNTAAKLNVEVAGGNAINIFNTQENAAFLNFIDSQSDGTQYANLNFNSSGTNALIINNMGYDTTISNAGVWTFPNNVNATTFIGNLQGGHTSGTISSGVTAVTQPNATDNTTIATTAYVVNKIAELPAGLQFLGTWNADTNTPTLATGGGERSEGTATTVTANKLIDSAATFTTAPAVVVGDRVRVVTPNGPEFALVTVVDSATQLTLASDIVTAIGETYILEVAPFLPEGSYYIVSNDGATDLNGITDWKVGDWAVASSTNVWQKIDNSSVLDGQGTGQTIPLWSGSGNSNTLTNSNITQTSSTNVKIASSVHITDSTQYASGQASVEVVKLQRINTGGDIKASTEGHVSMWATDSNNDTEWARMSWVNDNDNDGGLESEGALCFWTSQEGTLNRAMYIDHNQNVGIGTDDPSQKLTIRDDSTTVYSTGDSGTNTGDLVLQNNDETDDNFNRISFQSNSDNNQTGDLLDAARITAIYPDHAGGNPSGELAFETKTDAGDMAEAMRIDRDGKVGIGTDNPDSELDIRSDSSSAPVVLKLGNSVASGDNDVIISQLSTFIENSNTAANELGRIQVQNGASSHDDGIMSFWTRDGINNVDAARRMTIDGLGRVGIGIDAPLNTLSIESPNSPLIKIRNTTNGGGAGIEFNDNSGAATTQNGTLTYYHADGSSQGGGSSFWFQGQPDTVLVVGNGTNTGRVVVGGNSATEVGYGFYDDVNTGMFKPANHQLGFATNGTNRLTISTYINANAPIKTILGTAAIPALQIGDDDSGFYDSGANQISASTGGVQSAVFHEGGRFQAVSSVQAGDDTNTAGASRAGAIRYRTATNEPVPVTGIDFITNGDFATDANWTKSSNVSISGGQATFTANSAAQYIIQGSLWSANSLSGQKVQLTYIIVSNSLNAGDFRIGGYTGASAFTLQGLPTTVGTHSVTLDVRTSAGDDNAIDLYITSAATSGALVIDNVSVIEVTEEDASYADMCMQTGASTYEWVNIVRNTY